MPMKGEISIGIHNALRCINPRELHQIHTLSSVIDHNIDLMQITNGATRLQLMITFASLIVNTIKLNLVEYKLKYTMHQVHENI